MKRAVSGFLVSCLLLATSSAMAQDNGGTGGGSTSCNYCDITITGVWYCATSQFGGHQGACGITMDALGNLHCSEPTGSSCGGGKPVPPGPIVIH